MATEEVDAPKDIKTLSIVYDLSFHPEKDVIAAGDIDGEVNIYSYSVSDGNHQLFTLSHHKKACRALGFSPSGSCLYTASKDKSIQTVDMQQGAIKQALKKAHECAIYTLLVVDEDLVVTGDDDGTVKVWDMRLQKAVMSLKENEETITDMAIEKSKRILVATSGDGTLTSFDIRKHKMKMQSELFDSEFDSVALMKGGQKVACGSGDGIINIFNWNEWGNISDRFPGHPMSIDCMQPINEDIVCTGCSDGKIRAVNLLPNRILGIIGSHEEFPIESLSVSRCGQWLASCSHDQKIKFWNILDVPNEKVDANKKNKKSTASKALSTGQKKQDFFADLVEPEGQTEDGEQEDEDDSDDDEDEEEDDDSDDDSDKE